MGLSDTAKLMVEMNLGGNFIGKMGLATGQLDKFNAKADTAYKVGAHIGSGINSLATNVIRLGAVALGAVGVGVRQGLGSLSQLQSAIDANDAAIQKTGAHWTITGKDIAAIAGDIETAVHSAFDDKDIAKSAVTLIRFGKVTQANLKPALVVMTDLATKTGSVDSAATLLAKALAAPEKAAGKLARAGVILTKQQQKQIDLFIKQGKLGAAQKVILDALAKTTGGAAAASLDKYAQSGAILKDVIENAEKALATGFVPVITKVKDLLSGELAKPNTLKNIEAFGNSLAGGLQNLIDTARGLPWSDIGKALGNAGAGAKAIFDAFMGLPPDTKNILIGLTALNKLSGGSVIKIGVDILQGVGGGLIQQFIGKGSPLNPLYVVDVGGGLGKVPGAPGVPSPSGGGLISTIAKVAIPVTIVAVASQAVLAFAEALNPPGSKPSDLAGKLTGQRGNTSGLVGGKLAITIDTRNLSEGNKELVDHVDIVRDRMEANRIALNSQKQDTGIRLDNLNRAVRASQSNVSLSVRTSVTVSDVTGAVRTHAVYSTGMSGVSGVGHGI